MMVEKPEDTSEATEKKWRQLYMGSDSHTEDIIMNDLIKAWIEKFEEEFNFKEFGKDTSSTGIHKCLFDK